MGYRVFGTRCWFGPPSLPCRRRAAERAEHVFPPIHLVVYDLVPITSFCPSVSFPETTSVYL